MYYLYSSSKVQNNVWTNFFINKIEDISEDDGWIDCEKEISEIIKAMDYKIKIVLFKNSHGEMEKKIINKVKDFKAREFLELYREKSDSKLSNYWEGNGREKFIKNLQKDLEGFIWCLKIYLMYIVDKIETNIKNKDIEGISNNIDAVLSFNYTDTYRKIYNNHITCNFIHGEAFSNINKNSIVLGIDEYLDDSSKNSNLDFIYFKKYFQRLYKKTSFQYKVWIENMKAERKELLSSLMKLDEMISAKEKLIWEKEGQINLGYHLKEKSNLISRRKEIIERLKKENTIYIFGHSLDVTDKDVLRKLLLGYDDEDLKCENINYNTKVIIFYLNKEVYMEQLTHLVEIIGQDELIKRTTDPKKSIIFVEQKR
ncbi:Bacteriophage abortive infection AbiH [Clostridium sp. DSM 8431]|uniref:AbiH family protein n=1 Tax=Clostridium sp. DSM 8431 TaxID=1761781 RepID=UPI0008E93C53|nr:AbiH family protein [Clostridium sp. DSM 8431]SFU79580.1 Bacteriophage abortive infection AbiH [Clostridium sp. DSM 8431]